MSRDNLHEEFDAVFIEENDLDEEWIIVSSPPAEYSTIKNPNQPTYDDDLDRKTFFPCQNSTNTEYSIDFEEACFDNANDNNLSNCSSIESITITNINNELNNSGTLESNFNVENDVKSNDSWESDDEWRLFEIEDVVYEEISLKTDKTDEPVKSHVDEVLDNLNNVSFLVTSESEINNNSFLSEAHGIIIDEDIISNVQVNSDTATSQDFDQLIIHPLFSDINYKSNYDVKVNDAGYIFKNTSTQVSGDYYMYACEEESDEYSFLSCSSFIHKEDIYLESKPDSKNYHEHNPSEFRGKSHWYNDRLRKRNSLKRRSLWM